MCGSSQGEWTNVGQDCVVDEVLDRDSDEDLFLLDSVFHRVVLFIAINTASR